MRRVEPASADRNFPVDPPRRVALTGGTGFVGRRLARLLRRKGYDVRALVRREDAFLAGEGVETVLGSLGDRRSLSAAFDGADVVIHAAGAIKAARQKTFHTINVEGTAAVLATVTSLTPRPSLVLVSSLAAREPRLSGYAASKRQAETLVLAERERVEAVVVRPPVVYGPGDRATLPLFRAMSRGIIPAIGSRAARFSMIYVDDLAALIENMVREERWDGRMIEPDDGRRGGYLWSDIATETAEYLGRDVRCLRVPPMLLWPVAGASAALAAVTGRAAMLTPGKLREMRHPDWVCDVRPEDLPADWRPEIRFKEGLGRTLVWYKRHHYM